eukprot:jgi/Mesen1/93/ME1114955C07692
MRGRRWTVLVRSSSGCWRRRARRGPPLGASAT